LKNNKKILIVGGTGFIGYHLAKKSIEIGWQVTSISTKVPLKKRRLKKVKYIICDITKKNILKKKVKNYYNYIVNLGGYVDHLNRDKTFKSHYIGCKNLTEIFFDKKPLAFLQMGSSGEYGRSMSPQYESSACKPKLIYGQAKLLASRYLIKIFREKQFPVIILRLYQAYGPKQDFNRLIPIVINACIKNKKFPCSDGKQKRDFLYVDDVTNAIIKALKNKKAIGQIINIGTGKPKKIKNIIENIKKNLKGGYPQFGKIKLRKDEILTIYPSIKKAKNILNWKPKMPFDKGLKITIKSYNE
jgi:nucleoside-diphosphate-sugar epimerase